MADHTAAPRPGEVSSRPERPADGDIPPGGASGRCEAYGCAEPERYRCSWKDLACGAALCTRHGRDTGDGTALCNVNPMGVTYEETHVRPRPLRSHDDTTAGNSLVLLASAGLSVLVGAALEGWHRLLLALRGRR